MKIAIVIVCLLALSLVVGCGSPKGGGISTDEGFRLTTPLLATSIKQGDRKTVTVAVKRDEHFKEDVKLVATASDKIDIEPDSVRVEASDPPEVQFQISVPKDAAIGEYRILIEGTPETGQPTSTEIKVKVVEP